MFVYKRAHVRVRRWAVVCRIRHVSRDTKRGGPSPINHTPRSPHLLAQCSLSHRAPAVVIALPYPNHPANHPTPLPYLFYIIYKSDTRRLGMGGICKPLKTHRKGRDGNLAALSQPTPVMFSNVRDGQLDRSIINVRGACIKR